MSVQVLSKIGEDILAEAEAQARRKVEEAQQEARNRLERAKDEAAQEATLMEKRLLENTRLMEERKLSEARRTARLEVLAAKNEIVSKAFDEASKRLKAQVGRAAYYRGLRSLLEATVVSVRAEELNLKVNATDMEKKTELTKGLKLPAGIKLDLDKNPAQCIGGFILSTPDGKVKVDNTLEARLAILQRRLRKEVLSLLTEKKT